MDKMKPPNISILLPVYNGGAYLKDSVMSVLRQDFDNFELLIVDDFSNDGSREWLEGLDDRRILYFKNEKNKGLFFNLNFLISQAASPLIKLWAQDDIMYEHCIRHFVLFHEKHPSIGFSYCMRDHIDEKGELVPGRENDPTPSIVSSSLHARIAYFTGSIAGNIANTCISKTALDKVGLFNEHMKISADFDMWVRLARHYDTGHIREKLIKLRDHAGQLSRNENFYINHVLEDLDVYRYLDSYVAEADRKKGIHLMRNHKLVFYTTLMMKAFLNGNTKLGKHYWKALSGYDNILKILFSFIKVKLLKIKAPSLFTSNEIHQYAENRPTSQ